jgi:hypothetical protein
MLRIVKLISCLLLFAAPSFATTYYVSTSGSDTNNGTSKTTPWAHLPGMANATGTPGSYSAVAGDTFILKGCDVWYNASFPIEFKHGGASGNPVKFTVDQTWYNTTNCPSAWNRPVFDAHVSATNSTPTQVGGSTSGCVGGLQNTFVTFTGSYITMEWVEFRNFYYANDAESGCYGGNMFWRTSSVDYIILDNLYEHDWSMHAYQAGTYTDTDILANVDGSPLCPHCSLTKNIANNCAHTSGSGTQPGGTLNWVNITYSIFNCMSNAYKPSNAGEFGWNEITGNGESPDPTIHANCIETLDSIGNGGVYYIHDNRIHDNYDCEGGQIGNPGETDYIWNNIWYSPGPGQHGPQVPQSETPVAMYYFNNTVVDWDSCIHDAAHGYSWSGAFHSQNNLCINSTGSGSSGSPSANPAVVSNNIGLTDSVATSDGYTSAQALVYSPKSASSPTVGTGANLTSLWPAAFAKQDSSITCAQQTVNTVVQVVCTGTPNIRPASGNWDVGAYQFSSSTVQAPAPPTNVKVVAIN